MAIELLHRRESIILTAIEIIGDLGFQGLSTKELAKRQGISEGTLFRHFRTKNEIILAVLEYFSRYDRDIFATAWQRQSSGAEALLFVTEALATYYENYPAIAAVGQLYGILSFDPELSKKVKEIVTGRNTFFCEMIAAGQARGELSGDDAEALADVIYGTFKAICLRWWLDGQSFPLRERIVSTLQMLLNQFALRKEEEIKCQEF